MKLTVKYTPNPKLGYGRMGVKLVEAFDRLGVEMSHNGEDRFSHTRLDMSFPSHSGGWYEGQSLACLTMWEATHLPEGFRDCLHHFDTLIVPSPQNAELFGVYHNNVHMVPLGIDPDQWAFVPRTARDEFVFLCGGSGARKGTDLAYRAFRDAFPDRFTMHPTPRLVLKNPKREPFQGPGIEMVGGYISGEHERELYRRAHCYVQPSRGEGFGMQPLQAIAQGIPTILTDAHGHKTFSHLGFGVPAEATSAGDFIFGEAGEWWEPDYDTLVEQMRWVYHNYADALEFAVQASDIARDQFTWEIAANRILDALGRDNLYGFDGGEWRTPEPVLFPLKVTARQDCTIGGHEYLFVPGEDYLVPADVKRIMQDAGYAHPDCVESPRLLKEFV